MKKTIAILLVLVIGMVGVWAAVDNSTLTINAEVSAINLMGIYSYGAVAPSDNTIAWTPTYENTVAITTTAATNVATLHTRSNNRTGFEVKMTAYPLKSEVTGQATTYLGYSISTLDQSSATVTSTVTSYSSGAVGNTVKIIDVDAIVGGIHTESRNLSVTIPDIVSAPAGTYKGDIVFEYTAT
ncbi:MAG: hypothetical protein VB056_13295 [Sphaerochaeta associata]|uniref:hypothetical protein n=1 Tax=Sphaerochaeta associata TaxID=1129264 RepID=UPI002B214017|nr:hypothetical protein [Sphaerochaeta associata]MEA5029848.1 hypothetical protein [Sphaerochaeta associata]